MEFLKNIFEDLSSYDENTLLENVLKNYSGYVAFSNGFNPEGQVILHMLSKLPDFEKIHIFTIDTGRLFEETHRLIEETEKFFNIKIRKYFPDCRELEEFITKEGVNCFYKSRELRNECCRIRKVEPMKRAVKGKSIWISGLRKQQSSFRKNLEMVSIDDKNHVVKINPLINWSREEVWEYIKKNNIPYNDLHNKAYLSIGCACCTRAVQAGESERDGRWWWEKDSKKECGLHYQI
ncbi:MAG: phosphoadenylyl-sulfate reductase [Flexistipes sinusarabici]|uniref:Adenosine 5'-phosphosulfate reductase n=1 Tax=Flexistipes sinusarabici TaxID=2352 RepID=A0A5D0MKQ2_FLESI|nr:phosphoadenylyl-sulfate reductase [Flexistipes sinusarabici]TYB32972.1 MAG: phosphoadenylyl-sulfate reductase [Flexistipes sinusarabici]